MPDSDWCERKREKQENKKEKRKKRKKKGNWHTVAFSFLAKC